MFGGFLRLFRIFSSGYTISLFVCRLSRVRSVVLKVFRYHWGSWALVAFPFGACNIQTTCNVYLLVAFVPNAVGRYQMQMVKNCKVLYGCAKA